MPLKGVGKVTLRLGETDLDCLEQVFLQRVYEYSCVVDPEVIIDAGANVGMATLFFATRYPNAKVIALEPERSNFELLRANCSGLPNVTLLNAALWSHRVWLQPSDPTVSKWAFSFTPSVGPEDETVEGVSMMDLLNRYNLPQVDILKLDIEGAEREVFAHNASPWLDKVRVIGIELHDRLVPGCSRAFYEAMCAYDFNHTIVGESVFVELLGKRASLGPGRSDACPASTMSR